MPGLGDTRRRHIGREVGLHVAHGRGTSRWYIGDGLHRLACSGGLLRPDRATRTHRPAPRSRGARAVGVVGIMRTMCRLVTSGVYEGTMVGEERSWGGRILTRSTRPMTSCADGLEVEAGNPDHPAGCGRAGRRPRKLTRRGLQVYTPIIVTYRAPGTVAAVAMESALRT
jgi:hypothetical protein